MAVLVKKFASQLHVFTFNPTMRQFGQLSLGGSKSEFRKETKCVCVCLYLCLYVCALLWGSWYFPASLFVFADFRLSELCCSCGRGYLSEVRHRNMSKPLLTKTDSLWCNLCFQFSLWPCPGCSLIDWEIINLLGYRWRLASRTPCSRKLS